MKNKCVNFVSDKVIVENINLFIKWFRKRNDNKNYRTRVTDSFQAVLTSSIYSLSYSDYCKYYLIS